MANYQRTTALLLVLLVPLALLVQPAVAKQAVAKGGEIEQVTKRVQEKGVVRVIVGLDLASQILANAQQQPTKQDDDEEQVQIKQKQEAVIKGLMGHNITIIHRYEHTPHLALEIDAPALKRLLALDEVATIHESKLSRPQLAESTALIGAPNAWRGGRDGTGWTVAVVDSGVQKNHPFLTGKVVSEACYSRNLCPDGTTASTAVGSGAPCKVKGCDHGTHVAGIVAGRNGSFNGQAFSGVAPDATLISIQINSITEDPSCDPATQVCVAADQADQLAAFDRVYALRNTFKIAAVNMSFGGGTNNTFCDGSPFKPIIDKLKAVNIASVFSAGNQGSTVGINEPACVSSAIGVGATQDGSNGTTKDAVWGASNNAPILDLLAPGSSIISSLTNSTYGAASGTSMAAPHVAGAFAVMRELHPNASVDGIREILEVSGVPVTDTRNGISLTKPRIQLDRALSYSYSVGVIPAAGATGCPGGIEAIRIFMDDEDTANANSRAGWIGGIVSGANTDLRFCRVDGTRLSALSTTNTVQNHYAVLRLGLACPSTSVEFNRFFDNENSINDNLFGGRIRPNVSTQNTRLYFCLFRSVSAFPMASFPSYGFSYGVFAAYDFSKRLETGWILTDDENDTNANTYTAGSGWLADAQRIISGGSNTRLNLVRVQ